MSDLLICIRRTAQSQTSLLRKMVENPIEGPRATDLCFRAHWRDRSRSYNKHWLYWFRYVSWLRTDPWKPISGNDPWTSKPSGKVYGAGRILRLICNPHRAGPVIMIDKALTLTHRFYDCPRLLSDFEPMGNSYIGLDGCAILGVHAYLEYRRAWPRL